MKLSNCTGEIIELHLSSLFHSLVRAEMGRADTGAPPLQNQNPHPRFLENETALASAGRKMNHLDVKHFCFQHKFSPK